MLFNWKDLNRLRNKDFYRADLIHLAGEGVAVFAGNLEKEIIRVINKEDQGEVTGLSETSPSEIHSSSRNMNVFDQYRDIGDRTFRPNKPADSGNR